MTIKVGDIVEVSPEANRMGGGTFVVQAVGRKWFKIGHHGRARLFALDTGQEKSDGCGGYCYARTPEKAAEERKRSEAAARCIRATRDLHWTRTYTTEDLEVLAGHLESMQGKRARP